jgi:hypothetical protein
LFRDRANVNQWSRIAREVSCSDKKLKTDFFFEGTRIFFALNDFKFNDTLILLEIKIKDEKS